MIKKKTFDIPNWYTKYYKAHYERKNKFRDDLLNPETLFQFLALNKCFVNSLYKISLNKKESRNNIIKTTKYYINEIWKEENLIDISVPSYLVVNTKIQDKNSLKKIIKIIKKINLIDSYIIQELDNKSAKIKIKFFGKIQNLQNSFLNNGIEFKILHDEWNLNLKS